MENRMSIVATSKRHAFTGGEFFRLRRAIGALSLLFATTLPGQAHAAGADAGACARDMMRQTFAYLTPQLKYRDPRTALPPDLTVARRRELHPVLWPVDSSGRISVRQWLIDRNFDCLEEGFADLSATQARYPDGAQKLVSFLGGARDFVDASGGMTEGEIDQFIQAWRARYPASLLAELMWPRLLIAAAWNERGGDWPETVPPDRMRAFIHLNAVALRRAQAWSPAASGHVLGRYIALRAIADNGASKDQIAAFALAGLQRFPQESGLAVIAGERMLRQWGGSPEDFERFALAVRDTVGPALADRTYADLYVQDVGVDQLHQYPLAQLPRIRAGLVERADQRSFDGILRLQEFACARRDEPALRHAQALWREYGSETQLRGPQADLDARCREWARSLPPADPPASSRPAARPAEPARAAGNLFSPAAAPEVARRVYDIQTEDWERLTTPAGEVFSCKVCEFPVQVLVAVGPPLGTAAPYATNERFLAMLGSPDSQARVARDHVVQSAQLDPAISGERLRIASTDFAMVDGVKAFRYESVLRLGRSALRESALELVHGNRMLRIAVSRGDGPVGRREAAAVQALIESVRLRPD